MHTLAPLVVEGTKPPVPPTRRLQLLNMSEPESSVLLKLVAQMVSGLPQLENIWLALVMPERFSNPRITVQFANALNQ